MALTSIGDIARAHGLRHQNTALKTTLGRLGQEVASGRVSDGVARVNGHFAYLAQIERDLILTRSLGNAVTEVGITSAAMQNALGQVSQVAQDLQSTLVLGATGSGTSRVSIISADARGALDAIISAFNTSVAGRHVFAGTEVGHAPLASAQDVLAALSTALAGVTGPADARIAADAFFDDPGGGFETLIYQGGSDGLAPVSIGEGEAVDLDLRADNVAIRAILKEVSLAALADDGGLALTDAGRQGMVEEALNGLLGANDAVISLRAELGFAEERIDRAGSRIEAEQTSLQLARNALLEVDPYEAASELEAVSLQLETLYSVTARLSRLSLVNFLS